MRKCMWAAGGLVVLLSVPALFAGIKQPIGLATNESEFVLASSTVSRNATLFDGDAIQSLYFATNVRLKEGSSYTLGIESEGVAYQDYFLLSSGKVEVNRGSKPAHVAAGDLNISAASADSSATIYLTDSKGVTIQVHSGEFHIIREGSRAVTELKAGELVTLLPHGRNGIQVDSDHAITQVVQAEAEEVSVLAEGVTEVSGALAPVVENVSAKYLALSAGLASYEAQRSALERKISIGAGTPADQLSLESLDNQAANLEGLSAAVSADLNHAVIFLHDPSSSLHTVHGHHLLHPHACGHRIHGHLINCNGGGHGGNHQVPPHHFTG